MDLHAVMARTGATEHDLDIIAQHLLENSTLSTLKVALGSGITLENTYALARVYAIEALGETVAEIAPRMAHERMAMVEAQRDDILARKALAEQRRRLANSLKEMDILDMLARAS